MASYDQALSLDELQQTLPLAICASDLISALDSLIQRSLVNVQADVDPPTFALPTLVKVFAVHQFMGQFTDERDPLDMRWQGAIGAAAPGAAVYAPTTSLISLSPAVAKPVQLSQWFQGRFDADWHSLDWLFESALRPAMRLRSAYHLRDDTFVKRCKPIVLSSSDGIDISALSTNGVETERAEANAVLLVALNQDSEASYQICVQAQPARGEDILPTALSMRLLDVNQQALATVTAEQNDTFIQLPYFRGDISETFVIELSLSDVTHRETFVI